MKWWSLSLAFGLGIFAYALDHGEGLIWSVFYGLFWEVWAGYRFAAWLWTH